MASHKRRNWIIAIIVILAVICGICLWKFLPNKNKQQPVSYITTVVRRGSVTNSVTATGTIEPITKVEVGTQVSGIVDHLYVDYNSEVKKGQIIAELDKTNLKNELNSAKSNLNNAKTEYEYQEKNYNRIKALHDKQLVSETDFETAWYNYSKAKNSYEVSKIGLAKAETNLGYATIYSPIDGVVLSKSVEEGQTVAASFSTPTLFTIAADLTQMQVVADVDEADIGEVKEGQRVNFNVDAYPGVTFEGEITQVRQEATTTSNVVTYEVVINAPNPDLKLKPGMTANVTIFIVDKQNVLCVSNKALKFSPRPPFVSPEDVINDCDAKDKLWIREANTFTAKAVNVGSTNGTITEVSGIAEGTVVVEEATFNSDAIPASFEMPQRNGSSSPFMPGPPPGGRK